MNPDRRIGPHRSVQCALPDVGGGLGVYHSLHLHKGPAGGFITTAEDLGRFAIAVMDHHLVSQPTLEMMLTPQQLPDGEVLGFGMGWGLFPGELWYGEREAFHGGGTPQVSAMLYLLPDRKFAVAILMNLESVSERTSLAAQIAKDVLDLGT